MFTRPFADNRKVSRWAVEISQYPCEFRFKQGESNTDADALSRLIDPYRQGTVAPLGLDIDDNCENMQIYEAILPILGHHKKARVYEPFRGSGKSGNLLASSGFKKVIHPMTNFLNEDERPSPREYDIIISHPPRSLLRQIFIILKKLKKPFCLWCPAGVVTRKYCPKEDVQVIIVRGEIVYDGYKKPSRTRSVWVCWKMNLKQQLAYTDLPKKKDHMSAEQSKGPDREGKKRETDEERKTTKDLPKTTTIRRLEQEQAETVVPDILPQVFVRKIITRRANVRALSYKQKKQRSVERATILDWETTPTMATLAKAQAADEYLSGILKILNNEEKKSPDGKNTVKVPRMQRWYYQDINGIIRVLRNESDLKDTEDDTVFPVAVPKAQQHRLVYYYHNSLWAMHMGWRKGAALLQKAFFWVGMRRDLKDHVNRCLQCKQAKTTRPRRQGLTKLFFRTGPFECVHVDFVGPLSKIDGKWQYVFTVIDAFSRWVHLIPYGMSQPKQPQKR